LKVAPLGKLSIFCTSSRKFQRADQPVGLT
jgi:hypothetical protein